MSKERRDTLFGIGGLILAVLALVVSLLSFRAATQANGLAAESNELARDAIKASLANVQFDISNQNGLVITADECLEESSSAPHVVRSMVLQVFTFSNRGGMPVSLLSVDFEGPESPYEITIYDNQYETHDDMLFPGHVELEELTVPLDIDAGKAEVWMIQAAWDQHYETPEERARQFDQVPETMSGQWSFRFSDDRVLTQEFKDVQRRKWQGAGSIPCFAFPIDMMGLPGWR